MEEVETFQRRVVELEKQLEEKSLMPADAQLDNETQQNQEAMEKVATFEMRVAELEKQLENYQMPADAQEQVGDHQFLLTVLLYRMLNPLI